MQPTPKAPLIASAGLAPSGLQQVTSPPVVVPEAHMVSLLDMRGAIRPLEEVEADAIRFAITHYHGQMSEVARRLQIGRSTLYRKLDGLGLNPEPSVPENVIAG